MKTRLLFLVGSVLMAGVGTTLAQNYIWTTIAGMRLGGSTDGPGEMARFEDPFGIAVDRAGRVYVADHYNHSIRKLSPHITEEGTNWVVNTIAGVAGLSGRKDGLGSEARFNNPRGITIDHRGILYVTEVYNNDIRMIAPSGTNWMVTTIAGSEINKGFADGPASRAKFALPTGLAVDKGGTLYVADTGNHLIRKLELAGAEWMVSTVAGSAGNFGMEDGTNATARFNSPLAIAIDSEGTLYIADSGNAKVRKITPLITPQGTNWVVSTLVYLHDGSNAYGLNGITVDKEKRLFLTDTQHGWVVQLSQEGSDWVAKNLAGWSVGWGSDAIPGADFMYPQGIAIDSQGRLYVTDSHFYYNKYTGSKRVLQIAPVGTNWVTTVLTGASSPRQEHQDGLNSHGHFYAPQGVDMDSEGSIYVAEGYGNTIRRIVPEKTATGINWRVITIAGKAWEMGLTDGTGNDARFNNPKDVAVDSQKNVYVADSSNHTIRKLTQEGANWVVTTIAGKAGEKGHMDGPGDKAQFSEPNGITVDGDDTLYVTTAGHTIRQLTRNGTNWLVTTIAGQADKPGGTDGVGSKAQFSFPLGITADGSGQIWVVDAGGQTVRKLSRSGPNWLVSTMVGSYQKSALWDGTNATMRLYNPQDIAVDQSGTLYVIDQAGLRRISKSGTNLIETTLKGFEVVEGSSAEQIYAPKGLVMDGQGNLIVTEGEYHTLVRIRFEGSSHQAETIAGLRRNYIGGLDGVGTEARFSLPMGLAVDNGGQLYLADSMNAVIRKMTPQMTSREENWLVSTFAGRTLIAGSVDGEAQSALFGDVTGYDSLEGFEQIKGPEGVALDSAGHVYVTDAGNCTIRKISREGSHWMVKTIAGLAGNPGLKDGLNSEARFGRQVFSDSLWGPTCLALDSSGNVYVSDTYNDAVRMIRPLGTNWMVSTIADQLLVSRPQGIVADPEGHLFVANSGHLNIVELIPGLTHWTKRIIAGNSSQGGGDNGIGTTATFVNPCGLAMDEAGNLYVADREINGKYSYTIRKITRNITPAGTNWMVSTIGGHYASWGGIPGYRDGLNNDTRFSAPYGVAVDKNGNVYVADSLNGAIRKGTPSPDVHFQFDSAYFHGIETISWNAVGFDQRSTSVQVSAYRSGISYPIGVSTNTATGQVTWDTTRMPDGIYELRAIFYSPDAQVLGGTISQSLLVNNSVAWHKGAISRNETWAPGIHIIERSLVVENGATLTLQPGAIVKFTPGTGLEIKAGGIVNAQGTLNTPIVLTSWADDAVGGDSNLDDRQTRPTPGDWVGVSVSSGRFNANEYAEVRYTSVLVGGILSGPIVWGNQLYVVTNRLSLEAGSSLTIRPGAVIKLAAGVSMSVASGASFTAQGTAAQPITFTSWLDDSAGGDSNHDGDATAPGAGDWDTISLGGQAVLDYVVMRYGAGPDQIKSALLAVSGSATISNSRFSEGFYHGLLIHGDVLLQNCLVTACDRGLQYDGSVRVINSTFYQNRVALISHCGRLAVTNTIVADNWEAGLQYDCGTIEGIDHTDMWSSNTNSYANYRNFPDQSGIKGNFSADPKFVNPDQGDFRLNYGSPCIDAALGGMAPPTDLRGAPRYSDPRTLVKTGTVAANGAFADLGAFEFAETASSEIDLISTAIEGPLALTAGQRVQVQWTVANIGSINASGPWWDALSLVSTTDSNQVLAVAEKLSGSGMVLGPGQSYSTSAEVVVPGGMEGNYRWQVQVNRRGDLFEGTNWTNNLAWAETPSSLNLAELEINGSSITTLFSAAEELDLYKVIPKAGQDLLLTLRGDSSGCALELFIGQGYRPDLTHYDLKSSQFNSPTASLLLAQPNGGVYYVAAFARFLGGPRVGYALSATLPEFSLSSASPKSIANYGPVTLQVSGFLLDENDAYQLNGLHGLFSALDVQVKDGTTAYATFDLGGATAGDYVLQVAKSGGPTLKLSDPVKITATAMPQLSLQLQLPRLYRVGQPFNGSLVYGNIGNADMVAPILILRSGGQAGLRLQASEPFLTNDLVLIGASLQGPAGILRPGQKWTIPFSTLGPALVTIPFAVDYKTADARDLIDFPGLAPAIRPSGYSEEDWGMLWTRFQALSGPTWGGFVKLMAHYATLLALEKENGLTEGLFYSLRDVLAFALADCLAQVRTSVAGTVYLNDTDHPLANVYLNAANVDTAASALSAANGAFRFLNLKGGTYELGVPGYWLSQPLSLVVPVSGSVTGMTVVVTQGASLRGVVRNVSGAAYLEDVNITAVPVHADGWFATATGMDGAYLLSGLPSGACRLRVGGSPYETLYLENVHLQGSQTQSRDFALAPEALVRGKVISGGNPVPYALVSLINPSLRVSAAETDAQGNFTLNGLSAGSYRLEVEAPGYAILESMVLLEAGRLTELGSLLLNPGSTLAAMVQNASVQPVTNAWLTLIQDGEIIAHRLTDAGGRAIFTDLSAGTYLLINSAYGYQTTSNLVTLASGSVLTNVMNTFRLGQVTGRVTDGSGAPIVGINVNVLGLAAETQDISFATQTDNLGYYLLAGLRAGPYLISVGNNGGIDGKVIAMEPSLADQTVNFTLSGILLQGQVLASDGSTLLPSALVTLAQNEQLLATAYTDMAGTYRFRILVPGNYALRAGTMNGLSSSQGITIPAVPNIEAPALTLGTYSLAGQVTDASGKILTNASGVLMPMGGITAPVFFTATTSAEGRIVFSGLAAGSYTLRIQQPGFAQLVQTIALNENLIQAFSLFPGGSASGMITETASGKAIANAQVGFFDPTTHFLMALATTDSAGRYEASDLRAGNYNVLIRQDEFQIVELADVRVDQFPFTLNASLPGKTTLLQGTIKDESGTPIAGAVVSVVDSQGETPVTLTTGFDGTWSVSQLAPGNYAVSIRAVGYKAPSAEHLDLAAGSPHTLAGILQAVATDDDEGIFYDLSIAISNATGAIPCKPPADPAYFEPLTPKCACAADMTSALTKALIRAKWQMEAAHEAAEQAYRQGQVVAGGDVAILSLQMAKLIAAAVAAWNPVTGTAGTIFQGAQKTFINLEVQAASTAGKVALSGAAIAKAGTDVMSACDLAMSAVQSGNPAAAAGLFAESLAKAGQTGESLAKLAATLQGVEGWGPGSKWGVLLNALDLAAKAVKAYENWQKALSECQKAEFAYEVAYRFYVNAYAAHANAMINANAKCGTSECGPPPPPPPPPNSKPGPRDPLAPGETIDPNDKYTIGVGSQSFIGPQTMITYTILFENLPAATLPAQIVTITDRLSTNLDWSTLQLGEMGFNHITVPCPPGLQAFTTNVSVATDHNPIHVTASLNPATGELAWKMQSIDLVTGDLVMDPLAGFLPPNKQNHDGEGYVTFTVASKAGLATSTRIQNQALIVFDLNNPIATPVVTNTIDASSPTSSIHALPPISPQNNVTISWSGNDEGSGLADYTIYVSDNGASWTPWLSHTTGNSAIFSGAPGHTYAFFSQASDAVGNLEISPIIPGAQTTITTATPASSLHVSELALGSGIFQFQVTGTAPDCILQSSTNLASWTSLQTNEVPCQITVTNLLQEIRRFYRIIRIEPAFRLLSPSLHSGQLQFNITAPEGQRCMIQVSSNLVSWTSIETNIIPCQVMDRNAGLGKRKFYRAMVMP